jgi:hypothetical protein
MNATPPRKRCSARISAAAARLSARPVIEIAFGVSRDSISRLRAYSPHSAVVLGCGGRVAIRGS